MREGTSKETGIYEKRPTKETYKRDLQKRPTKETYQRDLQERLVSMKGGAEG